ncbi:hypothetical protein JAK47_06490 [Stenotrophomonas maltophilia]|uniref:hypothetical protein n=1 Tax=Stenotrophomonas maltophilia TaxID=40324 RepID=UPI0021C72420|nr:hypothetical protein [Stenotrophomonas maltophilia]MCU1054182.1 hypothetical protein [Stenotrophomonas maltophilia]MCU1160335.1 hypothetical protein [Stenotrophomonas maltophilia]
MGIVTIVPPPVDERSGLTRAQGTRVLVDGQELKGVTKVELVASVDDVWRARIECMAHVRVMPGMLLEVESHRPLSWWRRIALRIAGVGIDATSLTCTARKSEKP